MSLVACFKREKEWTLLSSLKEGASLPNFRRGFWDKDPIGTDIPPYSPKKGMGVQTYFYHQKGPHSAVCFGFHSEVPHSLHNTSRESRCLTLHSGFCPRASALNFLAPMFFFLDLVPRTFRNSNEHHDLQMTIDSCLQSTLSSLLVTPINPINNCWAHQNNFYYIYLQRLNHLGIYLFN